MLSFFEVRDKEMTQNNFGVYPIVNPDSRKRVYTDGTPSYSVQISYLSRTFFPSVPLILPPVDNSDTFPIISTKLLSKDVRVSLSDVHISVTKTSSTLQQPIRLAICEANDEEYTDAVRFFYDKSVVLTEDNTRFEIDVPDIEHVVIHTGYQLCFFGGSIWGIGSEITFSAILSIDD